MRWTVQNDNLNRLGATPRPLINIDINIYRTNKGDSVPFSSTSSTPNQIGTVSVCQHVHGIERFEWKKGKQVNHLPIDQNFYRALTRVCTECTHYFNISVAIVFCFALMNIQLYFFSS